MHSKKTWSKLFITFVVSWSFLISGFLIEAQDFVISSSIAGGSSVFAFPKSRKAPKKYAASSRGSSSRRTSGQRSATRRKISSQYNRLAKVTKRRNSIEVIKPEDLIPREDPVKASLALTGAAQYYLNDNQVDKAIDYFKQAYDLNSKNDLARLSLSDVLTLKGNEMLEAGDAQLAFAVSFYKEAIGLNAENSAALSGLGETYAEQGEIDKGIESYEKALKIDPDLTEVNAPLGILYFQKGDIAKADTLLKKALATEPDDALTQYFQGLVFYTRNENEAAEKTFRKAVALDPESDDAHYYLGATLVRLDREADAVPEFKEAIRINPKSVEAQFDLGGAYYNTGQYQESVDAYLKTVQLKNDYAEAYANLADGYRQLADREADIKKRFQLLNQALSRYMMAFVFIDGNPEVAAQFTREELADLYSRYGFTAGEANLLASAQAIRNNWDKAIELLTKAAEYNETAINYTNLGWAYFNSAHVALKTDPAGARDRLLKGKTALEKALTLDPNQVTQTAIRLNLGITSIDLDDYKAAIENLRAVTDNRKDWAFANYSLGVAYFKDNQLDEAIKQFGKAVETDPNYVAALSGLGNAYIKRGNKKELERVIAKLRLIGTRQAINEANTLQASAAGLR